MSESTRRAAKSEVEAALRFVDNADLSHPLWPGFTESDWYGYARVLAAEVDALRAEAILAAMGHGRCDYRYDPESRCDGVYDGEGRCDQCGRPSPRIQGQERPC